MTEDILTTEQIIDNAVEAVKSETVGDAAAAQKIIDDAVKETIAANAISEEDELVYVVRPNADGGCCWMSNKAYDEMKAKERAQKIEEMKAREAAGLPPSTTQKAVEEFRIRRAERGETEPMSVTREAVAAMREKGDRKREEKPREKLFIERVNCLCDTALSIFEMVFEKVRDDIIKPYFQDDQKTFQSNLRKLGDKITFEKLLELVRKSTKALVSLKVTMDKFYGKEAAKIDQAKIDKELEDMLEYILRNRRPEDGIPQEFRADHKYPI